MPSVFLLIILIFLYAPDFHVFLIGLLTKINREVSIRCTIFLLKIKKFFTGLGMDSPSPIYKI